MLMQGRFCAIFPEVLFRPLEVWGMMLPCSTWVGATVVNVLWRKMHPEPAGAGWWCSPVKDAEFWGNHLGMKWELFSKRAGKCCVTHSSSISKVGIPLHPKWPFQGHHMVTDLAFTERPEAEGYWSAQSLSLLIPHHFLHHVNSHIKHPDTKWTYLYQLCNGGYKPD